MQANVDCGAVKTVDLYLRSAGPAADPAIKAGADELRAACSKLGDPMNTTDVDQLQGIVIAAVQTGDTYRAIDALEHLLDYEPERYDLWKQLGDLFLDANDCVGADNAYDKYIGNAYGGVGYAERLRAAVARCKARQ